MKRNIFPILVLVLSLSIQGCSFLGFKVHGKSGDYARVDQSLDEGNLGYVEGVPLLEEDVEYRSTRKLYDVEVETFERQNLWEYILEKDAQLQENLW